VRTSPGAVGSTSYIDEAVVIALEGLLPRMERVGTVKFDTLVLKPPEVPKDHGVQVRNRWNQTFICKQECKFPTSFRLELEKLS